MTVKTIELGTSGVEFSSVALGAMVGNDRGADIIGGNRSGLTTVYLATGISPGSDGGFSPEADLSLAGADYDQVFDLATGGLNIGGDRNQS